MYYPRLGRIISGALSGEGVANRVSSRAYVPPEPAHRVARDQGAPQQQTDKGYAQDSQYFFHVHISSVGRADRRFYVAP